MSDERVYIRAVKKRDRAEFLVLMEKSRHLHEPWISPPLTEHSYNSYLKRTEQRDHEGHVICLHDSQAIVGVININNIVRGSFLSASLGYYAGAPYSGCGYMREGLELVKAHAFGVLGLHRLEANIQPGNRRSIELVRSCGFHNEGVSKSFLFIGNSWRDHERWAAVDARSAMLS
jgi:ribosomal-protein-alanine N-acetyltransferase